MRIIRLLPWAIAAVLGGLIAVGSSLPEQLPDRQSHLQSIHVYWYMGRASGFIAFGLLLASVVLGLGISSRVFDGLLVRPWVFEMHQFLSLYVLIAMVFHALIMLPDPYAQFKIWELLLPFASPYRPIAVSLGVVCVYGAVIVSGSYYVKGLIGHRVWRLLHHVSFLLFLMAMLHGIYAGTDSGEQWAQWMYLSSGLAVLFLAFFRILAARRIERREKKAARNEEPPSTPVPQAVEGATVAAQS